MEALYSVNSKSRPSIWDTGTKYKKGPTCQLCGRSESIILTLGATFPTWRKSFGIVQALGGYVVSREGFEYLKNNNIVHFEIVDLSIQFGRRDSSGEEYIALLPNKLVEIENGIGPIVCNKCGISVWREDDWQIHKIKGDVPADIFRIKNSWHDLATEHFIKVVKNIPGGCYLDFIKWN